MIIKTWLLYFLYSTSLTQYFDRWQIKANFVDMTDLAKVEAALGEGADLVWFETPSNPQLDIIDIAEVTKRAHAHGAKVLVDNTFASPALQTPIKFGADVVLQSTTKFIGGHSDVMGGALILKDASMDASLRRLRKLTGAVMAPFSAWLASRGLQTLFCRVEQQCRSAMAIAQFLEGHPRIDRVHYPGLANSPGHEIASHQMLQYGGLVSFQLKGGAQEAIQVAGKSKIFTTATSLGGVESLIEHRASLEGEATQTPKGLLRTSIGLEHKDDLITDLEKALG